MFSQVETRILLDALKASQREAIAETRRYFQLVELQAKLNRHLDDSNRHTYWTMYYQIETKILLDALKVSREIQRKAIANASGFHPDRYDNPQYFQLVDLQAKLNRHLARLIYNRSGVTEQTFAEWAEDSRKRAF
jgi:hypothetical protein